MMTPFSRPAGRSALTALAAGLILLLIGAHTAALPGSTQPGSASPDGPLRACFLNHDMPLGQEKADAEGRNGLYVDVAAAMAEQQDRTMEPHFVTVAFYKRPVREGLLAGKCDAYFGLPRGEEGDWFIPGKVKLSAPFATMGYALAVPEDASVEAISDLDGQTVAVLGGSPPVIALSQLDADITTHTVRETPEAMQLLRDGTVDAALVWGPQGGYYNQQTYDGAFRLLPTTLEWPVAIGVRAEDADQLGTYNRLIGQMEGTVSDLRAAYGLPAGEALTLDMPKRRSSSGGAEQSMDGIGRSRATGTSPWAADWVLPDTTKEDAAAEGDPERGAKLFNAIYGCAHCHGTNAAGATTGLDLRKLRQRHGDDTEQVVHDAIMNGRDGTAMPPWNGVISDEELVNIKAFLYSIQE